MRRGLILAAATLIAVAVAAPANAGFGKMKRPHYDVREAPAIESPYVTMHYVRTGVDHPRFMADDNHNGVPNYVEKAAAAANKAYLYYAHNGFKAPLPDTGGPSSKLDIYIVKLPSGIQGVTVPSPYAEGGAFMVIDNRLDEAHLAKNGSLQQTVAHELFHLFQLSYIPNGTFPGWVAEGSATALQTFVYPKIADIAAFAGVDKWLNQPWRSLYDERGGCEHCYGGALWWRFVFSLGGHVMSDYFGRLYGYEQLHKPSANGLQPLDEILQKRVHGSLFREFSRFSYDIYKAGYRPSPLYRLSATTQLQKSPPRVVRGLSTHYVPIAMPADAKGIGLGLGAGGGPNPDVKLVVGGPKGRVVPRVLRAGGHEQFFGTTFRNEKERANVVLIVTSGRAEGTAYLTVVQAL